MRSGKASAVWLAIAVVIVVACLGGGSVMIASFANSFKKTVEDRKQERNANDAIEQNVQKLLKEGTMGKRPDFANTAIGTMQRISYTFLETQLARQKTFMDELARIKFDWVMTPDSLRSEKNVEESLKRLEKARELADWFYDGLDRDLDKVLADMRSQAGDDSRAKDFITGFEESTKGPNGSIMLNKKVRDALRRNHDALEGCLKTLKANSGKYTVSGDGSITFAAGTSDSVITAYNSYVEKTTSTLSEINELEERRNKMATDALSRMGR